MTREEAIEIVNKGKCPYPVSLKEKEKNEAFDMAISALSEELSEDGTLTVHVSDGSKVKRVFVMGDNIFGGLYYPDSAENRGDLISREWLLKQPLDTSNYPSNYVKLAPSVEHNGEWIYDKSISNWRCSKCGQTPPPTGYVGKTDFMATYFKFCPDCGADMRGNANE